MCSFYPTRVVARPGWTRCSKGFAAHCRVEHRNDTTEERWTMGDKADDLKGRAKEAVGDITDNDKLKREGKIDRAAGNVKDKAEDVVDAVKDKLKR
jgi:uncharacterized protein YjbJ (UPF0337 family)